MTRRIATAILLTVWAILLIAGGATYVITRSVLLATLDQSLAERAAALPELTDASGHRYRTSSPMQDDDRYIVQDDLRRTVARQDARLPGDSTPKPTVLSGSFLRTPDGTRFRTVTLKAHGRAMDIGDPTTPQPTSLVPVTVTFRGSAAEFDRTMSLLGWTLLFCGVTGGIIPALVARRVARAALRPVLDTAAVIGSINDRALDRRIDTSNLPAELQPVADKLNDMLARLEEAFARQRRFLADASHELRTPVAAMITTLEVALRRPRDASNYRAALETSLDDARLMHALVDSLMGQARAQLKLMDEPACTIDVSELIDQTVVSMTDLAQEKQIRIECSAEPMKLRTQPTRLRSVLMNLIGNAIDHNPRGGRINVTAKTGENCAKITIGDTGPGIAPEHLPHLFDPFYRADQSRAVDGHLGLGLFLVKTHVQMLGGEVSVESELGRGASFTIVLPGLVSEPYHARETRPAAMNLTKTPVEAAVG